MITVPSASPSRKQRAFVARPDEAGRVDDLDDAPPPGHSRSDCMHGKGLRSQKQLPTPRREEVMPKYIRLRCTIAGATLNPVARAPSRTVLNRVHTHKRINNRGTINSNCGTGEYTEGTEGNTRSPLCSSSPCHGHGKDSLSTRDSTAKERRFDLGAAACSCWLLNDVIRSGR